jgi:wyosine [tRNA(Phe)-imidazoG37] synthetase (radical SAM superfamily)
MASERGAYAPPEEVADEVCRVLAEKPDVDYITFSGMGEPTLYSELGTLIRILKERTDKPVAVITNGSLLWREDVQDDLIAADLVMPSLDAGDARIFARVNRPHRDISFEKMVDGLAAFRKRFRNEMRLEVLLLDGLTDTKEELKKIAAYIERIGPDSVQLNTVVRSPAEKSARAVPRARLEELAKLLGPNVNVVG